MEEYPSMQRTWLHRFGWFVLIWVVSVAGLAIIAMFFRILMKLAGMTA